MAERVLLEYFKKLKEWVKNLDVKKLDFSQYNNLEFIGLGGCATVYSASFQGQKFAIKSINNNICLDDKSNKKLVRELFGIYLLRSENLHEDHSVLTSDMSDGY
ncbi:2048_t:CDS:2, partial [Scutellospora calospora]